MSLLYEARKNQNKEQKMKAVLLYKEALTVMPNDAEHQYELRILQEELI